MILIKKHFIALLFSMSFSIYSYAQVEVYLDTLDLSEPDNASGRIVAPTAPYYKNIDSDNSIERKRKNWIFLKDTIYQSNYYIDPNLIIEPISFLVVPSSLSISEIKELSFHINEETNDTVRSYNPNYDQMLKYDDKGRFKEIYVLLKEEGKEVSRLSTEYFYKGVQLTHKIHYEINGIPSAKQTYQYHKNGSIASEEYYRINETKDEVLISKKLYQYLDNHVVIAHQYEWEEDAEGMVLENVQNLTFDEKGRIIHIDKIDAESRDTQYSMVYEYLPNNIVIENTISKFSESIVTFEYNKEKRIVSIHNKNNGSDRIEFTEFHYILDSKGIHTAYEEHFKILDQNNQIIHESKEYYKREIKYKK